MYWSTVQCRSRIAEEVWEGQYGTCCVGGYWAGSSITLGLAEEIIDGRAQQGTALLLLTHQLKNQAEVCDEIYINALGLLFSYCFSCSQAASIAPWHLCMWLVTLVVTTLSAAAYLQDWDDNSHLAPLVQTSQAWGCFSLPFSLKQRESSPVKSQIVCRVCFSISENIIVYECNYDKVWGCLYKAPHRCTMCTMWQNVCMFSWETGIEVALCLTEWKKHINHHLVVLTVFIQPYHSLLGGEHFCGQCMATANLHFQP